MLLSTGFFRQTADYVLEKMFCNRTLIFDLNPKVTQHNNSILRNNKKRFRKIDVGILTESTSNINLTRSTFLFT